MKCTKCNVELEHSRTICPLCGCRAVNEPAILSCAPVLYPQQPASQQQLRRGILRRLLPTKA